MAAEKGSAFLLKVGDGAATPTYATVAGLRTTQLSINGESVVITSKASGGWRELLSGAGTRSVSVAGAGVFTGSAAEARLKGNALAGQIDDYELSFESGERMRGRFLLRRRGGRRTSSARGAQEAEMATLVLGAVGTVIGGPIGGAIGAALGNRFDQSLLAPRGRRGPRLGELGVQTSSYGSAIPRLFGTLRVAGTVIWATDLREDTHRSGGGKGGAKTTTYSYSASFAVALSARPIRDVGRIWADGKLLRTSAGEYKSETGFRLYRGGEGQGIDPLIASAEGIASTPAHRGIAYAVFKNLQLADYGNRIPSLTFEVVADDAPVAVRAIAAELADGAIEGAGGATVAGFAASGDSVRGAIEALAGAFPLPIVDDGAVLRCDDGAAIAIDGDGLGAAENGTAPRERRTRRAAGALPDEIAIAYYEPARDYQAGLQRARRDGVALRAVRIELAAALEAADAKGLAEAALARAWIAREAAAISLPWRHAAIGAGRRILLDGVTWRVRERAIEHDVVKLSLERDGPGPIASAAAAGRATTASDAAAGSTVLALLDLPALDDADAAAPLVWLAAAGTAPGWRRAEASLSFDGGASWAAAGGTAAPATMGTVVGTVGDGPRELFDRRNPIEIDLLHEGMALAAADEAALAGGANLAAIGDELLQFGSAQQLSARRWRIGDLLRGRRGTDDAIATHGSGERFVLIEPAALRALEVPLGRIGGGLRASALGPGDDGVAAIAATTVTGRAVRPPAPIALDAIRQPDGTIRFAWIRRSRLGWTWLDGMDAPLGEDREAYRLAIAPAGAAGRVVDCAAPGWDYPPTLQAADGWSGSGMLAATVVQLGTRAASSAAGANWHF